MGIGNAKLLGQKPRFQQAKQGVIVEKTDRQGSKL